MSMRLLRLPLLPRVAGKTRWIHASSQLQLQYGWLAYVLGERTMKKFTEYSKIITVDGNLASGKGQLAQQLAEKLGLRHFSELDVYYLDRTTGDGAILDPKFSGSCSLEKFYNSPKSVDGNSYRLQFWMFTQRMLQYSDALEHLLSTGQGVVLERSPFSDFVFLEAMQKQGYIRKECLAHYNEIKGISIDEFLPPHLEIYVDVPVADIYKKIQESGNLAEKKVSTSYLQSIEDAYKKNFLPQISETSEVLQYSGSEIQDVEKVIEDIEYLKFNKKPWVDQNDVSLHNLRMLVEDKQRVADLMIIPRFIPEVTIGAHEYDQAYYQYRSLPGRKYSEGYNADVGDKWIWLK
ncbi:NADH dehydrogenase [ubiquinone] 1 alpha subcomplex subunit 10, mitochondrial [Microcaecilia unicolor]|uniref:NADH dehydrogenase [ubiquinone] 1 alpha subcomplex subunit 10, mitochondrial n=1 Tax=Microcaecilia unicolor TaxID=1415580 RepID=A0A6P7YQW8_9AMPH|nr:NADH dehydrogenase [ubiquinone] 1 alpha subcomplex subunit 10, mitochondrial [Microcaecilia unicolor]